MGKKNKKQKSHLPLRLNILFFIIFLLFSGLILQLGVVQILFGMDAQEELDRTERVTSATPVPRGKMYDRNGELVVDNKAKFAITYTPKKHVQPEDNVEIAEKLAKYIEMDTEPVTKRNKQDYWIINNKKEAYERLTEEEKELSDQDQYYVMLEKISDDELEGFSEQELEVMAIKRELDKAYELTPHIIQYEDITVEEYMAIGENLHELPGINVTTDWERDYLFGSTFASYIGRITSQQQGIPQDEDQYFLARNYSRNDRVGRSGIEKEYELYLNGNKEIKEHITDSSGTVIDSNTIREGQRGKDLILSVDMELQHRIDKIVQEEVKAAVQKHPGKNRWFRHAVIVLMNPKTGEVLATSGQQYNPSETGEDEFTDVSHKVLYDTYLPGSTVKGATVLAGLDSGVIRPGEVITDRPIKISVDKEKSSWTRLGPVNDIDAIKRSSNVYMWFIAMRMGGEYNYQYGKGITYNSEAYTQMKNYYKQFGLGAKTGIDFPYEENMEIAKADGGELQDMAIGQYGNYTAMQLAQYISTIANDGYRMKPYLVKQIHNSSKGDQLGPLYKVNEPTILNKIEMKDTYLKRVQEGMRQAFQESGGTGYRYFADAEYNPAGKTGTAEAFYWDNDTKTLHSDVNNYNLVGYAPFDEPEIAFAVMAPYLGTGDYPVHHRIGRRALDTYFELKEERLKGSNEDDSESESEEEESEEE
ncbi:peptidoglycan D,D-transpeptidase FtsI family protein [Allobacillus sp. GCM10007491]|uniref:serine-type D-Ala-D-Ala carboxypeptidase n=1 Tax=Allobacillus saliphilus TaxID=2912308 RepID=A0A941CYF5_9BACI|nr:penicillin-binding protein 2 [Allobacillus saliphilus]MBR7554370.1 penicillin-binding protein 2 [Allobacillus saliphilus]